MPAVDPFEDEEGEGSSSHSDEPQNEASQTSEAPSRVQSPNGTWAQVLQRERRVYEEPKRAVAIAINAKFSSMAIGMQGSVLSNLTSVLLFVLMQRHAQRRGSYHKLPLARRRHPTVYTSRYTRPYARLRRAARDRTGVYDGVELGWVCSCCGVEAWVGGV